MKRYLLDTNACIAWIKNNPAVVNRLMQTGERQIYICAPVRSELWFGACNSSRIEDNQQHLVRFFAAIPSLPFDDRAAERCGEVRAFLKKLGTPIGPYDLCIGKTKIS